MAGWGRASGVTGSCLRIAHLASGARRGLQTGHLEGPPQPRKQGPPPGGPGLRGLPAVSSPPALASSLVPDPPGACPSVSQPHLRHVGPGTLMWPPHSGPCLSPTQPYPGCEASEPEDSRVLECQSQRVREAHVLPSHGH